MIFPYTVRYGKPLFRLAARKGGNVADRIAANPGGDPHRPCICIGQTVAVAPGRAMEAVDTANPYDYERMMEDLGLLKQRYPFLAVESIGRSVLGKTIPSIRIGSGPAEVHYNGSFHANEWITSLLLMKFIEDYASAYVNGAPLGAWDVRPLFEQTSLWIVPMVNPDGVELVLRGLSRENPYYRQLMEWNCGLQDFSGWKANIRGVDLNDQFPAHWEIERDRRGVPGPGPRDYTGMAPLSEPEALAMAEFTKSRNFQLVAALHTQGKEIYWNYRDLEPRESEAIACRLASVSGYEAVKLHGSDAGYKDWFIQEFRRPGFTVEAGLGVNPLPVSQFGEMYREIAPLLLEGLASVSIKS
ncbi:M14 family metallopeptidase [Paenibacillus naphthalenovorans]|uniref:M14 family metallopeptidase n=1 Tax=Paenibacillus naphthalenovorans TaxID=162209 RepID=UPI003D2BD455